MFIFVDDNKESLWKVLLSSDKPTFTNDRLLQSAPIPALSALATLSEMLVLQHPEKMTDQLNEQYINTLLYVCCHNDYSSRKAGQQCVKKIVSGLGGLSLALSMISPLSNLLNQQNWSEVIIACVHRQSFHLFCAAFNFECMYRNKNSAFMRNSHKSFRCFEKYVNIF